MGPQAPAPSGPAVLPTRQSWVNVVVALLATTMGFWAWALLSPLGPDLKDRLGLSSVQQALIVAVPVVVGSLGRIPVGWLAGRYGPRITYAVVIGLTAVPVYLLAFFESYAAVLVLGFFLGLGGASYAVGVPLSNDWFPPARRGFSIGLFSASDIGVAIAGLTVIRTIDAFGDQSIFLVVGTGLVVMAVVCWLLLRDLPGRPTPQQGMLASFATVIRRPTVLENSWLYAMTFGVYVALGVYAVTYFKGAHGTPPATASLYMALLVAVASAFRPVGGWLGDRLGPIPVLAVCFGLVVVGALGLSLGLPLAGALGVFCVITAACGTGASAVLGLLAQTSAPAEMAESSGIVAALGGMGGFFPPLVLGVIYGATGSFQIGFWMLAAVAAATAVFTLTVVRHTAAAAASGARTAPRAPGPP